MFVGQCGDRSAGVVGFSQRDQAAEVGEERLFGLRLLQSAETLQVNSKIL